MSTFPPPSPPYLGPPAHHSGTGNKPIDRIVIHSTVSPCVPGGARRIAEYFRSESAGGSAHYVTDPGETVQVAYDDVIAWHAPPNPHSIGIEMCDIPGPVPGAPRGSAAWAAAKRSWRWGKPNQMRMLNRTARLTARLCLAYDVPIRWLTPTRLAADQPGITSHANVSKAFGQSTHWDPGFWPRKQFMALVRLHAARLRRKDSAR